MHPRSLFPLLFVLLLSHSAFSQQVPVTLQVDFRNQPAPSNGISVAGNFQTLAGGSANWLPGELWLTDPDADSIYSISLNLPAGVYQYKYIKGSSWADTNEFVGPVCGQNDGGGNYNRLLFTGPNGIDVPPHKFDTCSGLTVFQVDMLREGVTASGIYAGGDWMEQAGYQGIDSSSLIKMTNPEGGGIFKLHAYLPDSTFRYRFYQGDTLTAAEALPSACSDSLGFRSFQSQDSPNILPTYCFGSCDPCSYEPDTSYPTYWWNDAVFYEIFVRSFYDSDGNGIGDFKGITQKLDYLNDGDPNTTSDLGVTGIWLMPMHPSPTYHGYDITNYTAVNPQYGSMADFEEFLDSAHARGIKVIIDLVMNHSSSHHPWFTASSIDTTGPFADWYIWSKTDPGFTGPWGQQVWHPRNGRYYYGLFWGGMPDLNYDEPAVVDTMLDAVAFWLQKGVDGFRLDAIKYLDEDFPILENTEKTLSLLEAYKQRVRSVNPTAYSVGEVWSPTPEILPYVDSTRLDMCFEFGVAGTITDAVNSGAGNGLIDYLDYLTVAYPPLQYAPFLSNHDQNRIFEELGQHAPSMKQAASLLMAMPGTPFMYYGEELGMTGSGAHENIRTPMQWTGGTHAGFTTGNPWRTVNNNYTNRNVETLSSDPNSLLNHYRKLIKLRNSLPALRTGYLITLSAASSQVASFARIKDGQGILILNNLGAASILPSVDLPPSTLQPGTYPGWDLISGDSLGAITIASDGSITGWQPNRSLEGNETIYLALGPDTPTSVTRVIHPEFHVFPNPASDYIEIRSSLQRPVSVELYDLLGHKIMAEQSGTSSMHINLAGLSPGIYIIRCIQGTAERSLRIVVI